MLVRSISRSFVTSVSKKVAIILSGCGVYDGSEIQESVFVLESLSRQKTKFQCFAPNIDQKHVINHLTGDQTKETRNVLIESARIARSDVKDIDTLNHTQYDALIVPGGFGVAKNLSNFGSEGPNMEVINSVSSILTAFHEAKKPIGVCCIAPILLARVFPKSRITLGQEKVSDDYPFADACGAAKAMGAVHIPCKPTEVCVDKENLFVSSSAYMHNGPIHEVRDSIQNMVLAVLDLA